MAFLSGGVTALRFSVHRTDPFQQDDIDRLSAFNVGRIRCVAAADGTETGWLAGDHLYDVDFSTDKNLRGDFLIWAFAVDSERLPADKLKAYYAMELKALAARNPSGIPSARQRREAKEAARDRLEEEAKDGRYKKRRPIVPVAWDLKRQQVWFGSSSASQVDRFRFLFERTFGLHMSPITPTTVNPDLAADDLIPSAFVPGITPEDVAWVADENSRDYLGNEFVMWLHHRTVGLDDKIGDTAVMLSRSLMLECPRGQTGRESFRHEVPTRLPEVLRALQSGKWPRSAGLGLVRDNVLYELTLQADLWAVFGGKVQKPEDGDDLYRQFLAVRTDKAGWAGELKEIQKLLSTTTE
jgi:hypothetical protein